jgi:HTH-type transcriptional regulator / antitoxin HigA
MGTTSIAPPTSRAPAFDVKAIRLPRTESEYHAALAEVAALMDRDPQPDSEDGARLAALVLLVEAYEDKYYPMPTAPGTPQDAVDFALDQHDLQRADLAPIMGGKSRVSEFFSGKRDLSHAQIRALHKQLGIPVEFLFSLDDRDAETDVRVSVGRGRSAGRVAESHSGYPVRPAAAKRAPAASGRAQGASAEVRRGTSARGGGRRRPRG